MPLAVQDKPADTCLPSGEGQPVGSAIGYANLAKRVSLAGRKEPALYERAAAGVREEFGANIGMVARADPEGIKTKTIDAAAWSDDPVAHSAADPAD